MKPIMKCGHAANAVDKNGNPCCAICVGFTPNAFIVDDRTPDLTGRKAKCFYCGKERESSIELPFFEYKPDKEYDKFYCGCGGWD